MDEQKIIQELTTVSERAKSNSHRLDQLDAKVDKLTEQNTAIIEMGASVKLLNKELIHMREDTDRNFTSVREDVGELTQSVKQVQKDVIEVKSEPDKKKADTLDKIGWLILSSAITGALGFAVGALVK